ncbi:hypothetical protein [Mycobacteroides abscessus]|uniref:hypothetical protein n=1 Tax=Mycobacteroides abscessus TaxID=36809 RepID=UPI000668B909|nr:hypothetical protein [Mycobacteroides abscessus]AKP56302.1 hypothetical protein MAUC22_00290 [Mycobacteroides abscessus UC22]
MSAVQLAGTGRAGFSWWPPRWLGVLTGQGFGEIVEIAYGGTRVVVADDIEAVLCAADGNVE